MVKSCLSAATREQIQLKTTSELLGCNYQSTLLACSSSPVKPYFADIHCNLFTCRRCQRGSHSYNQWQKYWHTMFFLTGCIRDRLPLPTPKTMLSFIHLTLRLYCNIVWGERRVCKIKYTVLKSKDSVMECYSIQRAKYFCY